MAKIRKDISGQWFSKWFVIRPEPTPGSRNRKRKWECICQCKIKNDNTYDINEIILVDGNSLRSSKSISCGCSFKIHNGDSTNHKKFYIAHNMMRYKCYNPENKEYHNYGGRGIIVCDRWLDSKNGYNNFKEDMFESYNKHLELFGPEETTLERIDVNGNYEPSNCTWATRQEQSSNLRKNRLFECISPTGQIFQSKCQSEFARQIGIRQQDIYACLSGKQKTSHGWKFRRI